MNRSAASIFYFSVIIFLNVFISTLFYCPDCLAVIPSSGEKSNPIPHFSALFMLNRNPIVNAEQTNIKSAVYLTLDKNELNKLLLNHYENINLTIPCDINGKLQEIELTRVSILSKNFQLKAMTANGELKENYEQGLYYRGEIKGETNSHASISIFKDRVIGIISTKQGNFVLGRNEGSSKYSYVYYNDLDISRFNKFKCGTEYLQNHKNKNKDIHNSPVQNMDSVRIYFVADHQMYIDNGSSITNTANFIMGFFNSVSTIYHNENIPIVISQIMVYEINDPYHDVDDAETILKMFGNNVRDNFPGDLAHLLSTGHNQGLGGISWINMLCQSFDPSDSSGRYAFSNISNSYLNFPVYSWTVYVVAHETGHNFGSKHTHACVWPIPGGIGAIDSCHSPEGNCFTYTQPNFNGTIMSYCHLNGYINFINGFGPLPGDTIRYGYSLASCLDSSLHSSQNPIVYHLYQNYPNPFSNSVKISFDVPLPEYVTLKIYDITGKEVATLINWNLGPGKYESEWNSTNFAAGIYFYKLQAGYYKVTNKMVLIR